MRFDLAAWASQGRRRRRRSAALPPIRPRLAAQHELQRIIVDAAVAEFERRKAGMIQEAAHMRARIHDDGRVALQDNRFSDYMAILRRTVAALARAAEQMVARLLKVEAVRHDETWLRQVNAAIGVDLGHVISQADVEPSIELATRGAVALISGLSEDVARRVETTLVQMITEGRSNDAIAEALDKAFDFGRTRARIIARDQVAKFNGALNRIRQTQGGVEEYEWWTCLDERVRGNPSGKYPNARPSHWDRHGKRFRWDSPPSDGHPGQPILCRCIARPVIRIPE